MHTEARTLLPLLNRATLTALLLACANSWAEDLSRAQVLLTAPSLVRVEAQKTTGGYAFGTAVVIAPDRVITNCHVTREALTIYVVKGGLRRDARAQRADVDHDLCLLWVPGLEARAAPLAASAGLRIGQRVAAIGFGGATGIQVSIGDVTGLHALDGAR